MPVLRHPWSALLAPYSRNLLDVSAPSAVISCGYCCAPAAAYEATHETAYEAVCGEMWRTRRRMRLFALLLLLALPPCTVRRGGEGGMRRVRAHVAESLHGSGPTHLRAHAPLAKHLGSGNAASTASLIPPL